MRCTNRHLLPHCYLPHTLTDTCYMYLYPKYTPTDSYLTQLLGTLNSDDIYFTPARLVEAEAEIRTDASSY